MNTPSHLLSTNAEGRGIGLGRPTSPENCLRFCRLARLALGYLKLPLVVCLVFLLMGGVNQNPDTGPQMLEQESSLPGLRRGPAMNVAVSGHFAYVATGPGGLAILDVSDPANPVRIGGYWTGGSTLCVTIAGSRAYVGSRIHDGGGCVAFRRGLLEVLEVSDPAQPRLLGSFRMPREVKQVQIIGNHAYVLGRVNNWERNGGLEVLDVSTPSQIRGLGSRNTPNGVAAWVDNTRVAVAGDRSNAQLYLGGTDPAFTTWSNQVSNDLLGDGPGSSGIWISGHHAYLTRGAWPGGGGRLEILNIASEPAPIGSMTTDYPLRDVQVAGNHAFIPAADGGLLVVDVTQPSAPKEIGYTSLPGCAVGLTLTESYAYVAAYDGGVHIVDIKSPAKPVVVGTYQTGLTTRNVRLDGNRAYLLSSDRHESSRVGRSQMELIDLTNPSSPVLRGLHSIDGIVTDYSAGNGLLCLLVQRGNSSEGDVSVTFEVVDWINAANPRHVSQTESPDGKGISVFGSHAYIVGSDAGLRIFDLAQPTRPRLVSDWPTDGQPTAVDVKENRVCIAGSGRLQLLNVSNPSKPVLMGQLESDERLNDAKALQLLGNQAYFLSGYRANIVVMANLEDPTKPSVLGDYPVGRDSTAVAAEGQYVFVARGSGNIGVIDVSTPSQFRGVYEWSSGADVRDLKSRDGRLYVADAGAGLVVLKTRQDLILIKSPESLAVAASEPATFRVAVTSGGPMTYQWYTGLSGDVSTPISGAISPELTIPQVIEDTSLWVRIQSRGQIIDSAAARVSVKPAMSLVRASAWPGYRMGGASAVKVRGNDAFIASGSGGLMTIDITNPAVPRRRGGIETEDWAQGLALAWPLAFVVGGAGLQIYGITNPAEPQHIGSYRRASDGWISRMVLGDSFACLLASDSVGITLNVVDIRNPANPKPRGRYNLAFPAGSESHAATGLVVLGTQAFIALSWTMPAGGNQVPYGRMDIIDLMDLDHPALLGVYRTDGYLRSIATQGHHLYLAISDLYYANSTTPGYLHVVDIANPKQPARAGALRLNSFFDRIFLNPPYAYLSSEFGELEILNISDPKKPIWLSGRSVGAGILDIDFAADRAYVAKGEEGLVIMDIKDPANPKQIGSLDTLRSPTAIAAARDYVLATDNAQVHVIDFGTNTPPRLLGQLPLENPVPVEAIAVRGTHAYLGGSPPEQFQILDLADPTSPRKTAGYSPGNSDAPNLEIAVADNLAYVAAGNDLGLQVVDVSNPAKPMSVGGYGQCTGPIAIDGSVAFIATGDGGVAILDISAPTRPTWTGIYFPRGRASDLALDGHHLIVAVGTDYDSVTDIPNGLENDKGLEILDLSIPARPVLASRILRGTSCKRVGVIGHRAFVLTDDERVAVVDVSEPSQPCIVAIADTPEASKLVVSGDTIYLAQGTYGVTAWRLQPRHRLNHPVLVGNQVRLSWLPSPGLRLQRASNLILADWQDVPGTEGIGRLELPFNEGAAYFRLRAP